jgi:hypothetical protein
MNEVDFNNFTAELQRCKNGEDISKTLSKLDEYDDAWYDDEMLTKMLKEVSKKGAMLKDSKAEVSRWVERIKQLRKPNHPICVICNKVCECQFGNNPRPLVDKGRCCNRCNQHVIEARIKILTDEEEYAEWKKYFNTRMKMLIEKD